MTTTDAHGNLHDGKGLFSNKSNTEAPDGIVPPPSAPATHATLQRELWGGYDGDQAIEVGSDKFDVTVILDTMDVVEVEELLDMMNHEARDRLYQEAASAGYVEPHDGPYTVFIDETEVEDYVAYRRDNNLIEPTRDDFPLSQKAQDVYIGRGLHLAYEQINVTDLFGDATAEGASVKGQFESAFNRLYWTWKGTQNVPGQFRDEDQAVYDRIEAVAKRAGDVHRRDPEAQLAAVTLMEWLLKRDAVLAQRSVQAQ